MTFSHVTEGDYACPEHRIDPDRLETDVQEAVELIPLVSEAEFSAELRANINVLSISFLLHLLLISWLLWDS